jgi:hypothetical protein
MSRPNQGPKRTIFRVLASKAKRYHCKVRSDRQLRLWQEVVRIFDWRSRLGGLWQTIIACKEKQRNLWFSPGLTWS